jgi:hypothetical protein
MTENKVMLEHQLNWMQTLRLALKGRGTFLSISIFLKDSFLSQLLV